MVDFLAGLLLAGAYLQRRLRLLLAIGLQPVGYHCDLQRHPSLYSAPLDVPLAAHAQTHRRPVANRLSRYQSAGTQSAAAVSDRILLSGRDGGDRSVRKHVNAAATTR